MRMGRTMTSREVIKALKKLGWYLDSSVGDHFQFKHDAIPGKVTVKHPLKDISGALLDSIERQCGTRLK